MSWPTKHGMYGTKEYRAWQEVKRRCLNKNSKDYARYGAKGITVDDLFKDSFDEFYKEVGPALSDKHSIDRIDGNKGYIKGNLRWSTPLEQAQNRKTSMIVSVNGVDYPSFKAAGAALGVTGITIQKRCKGYFDKRFNHWSKPKEGYSYEPRYNS